MKVCSVTLLLALSITPALGGENPHVFVYVDFDPPNNVQRIDPEPYNVISAYLMIDCVPSEFIGICFAVHVSPEMSLHTSYRNLMPNPGAVDGSFEEGILLSSLNCVADCPIAFAAADIVYSGTPGDVMIVEDPRYPRWVIDCDDPLGRDTYCLLSNGGVGKDPIPTGEMCGCPTPVESESWGTIKALFR